MRNAFLSMAAVVAAGAPLLAGLSPARGAEVLPPSGTVMSTSRPVLAPTTPSWERFFTLDWNAAERHGRPVVEGYVRNNGEFPATGIRLLVEALDEGGTVVGQRIAWLLSPELTPGTRGYFEVPVPQVAPRYRVSVYTFEWQPTMGNA